MSDRRPRSFLETFGDFLEEDKNLKCKGLYFTATHLFRDSCVVSANDKVLQTLCLTAQQHLSFNLSFLQNLNLNSLVDWMQVSINEPYTFNCDKVVSGRSVYTFMPEKTVVFTAEMVRKPFMYSMRLFLTQFCIGINF